MCGITGIIASNAKQYEQIIDIMLKRQTHRGPDFTHTQIFNNCILGHNRLSIIDLQTGNQPIKSTQSDTWIVLNGEIYGYKDIRKSTTNYTYKTKTDTEVILGLYEKHETNLLNHLPGMFAFAIWDEKKQTFFAARDRFGEKPFYYAFGKNNELIFASEIKTILESGLIKPIINTNVFENYLKHFYILPNKTIYKNIFILPPAHFIIYKNNQIHIEKYWKLPQTDVKIKEIDAFEQFNFLLENAIKKQMIADVPVGIFLSGGLDSSTIAAIASKHNKNIKTFSYGYKGSWNELPYAKKTSERYNTEHFEFFDNKVNIAEIFLKLIDIYDEPFADTAAIPTYILSKYASKHVKVVLGGDGADELLGGYGSYEIMDYYFKNKNNSYFKNLLYRIIAKMFVKHNNNKARDFSLKHYGYLLDKKYKNFVEVMNQRNSFFSDIEIKSIFPSYNNKDNSLIYNSFKQKENTPNDAMKLDIINWLPGDILTKTDRAAMANSLEVRSPFLDKDLAEFLISLPYTLKINKNELKYILRKTQQYLWVDEVRKRKVKQGFGSPVRQWLELPEINVLVNEYLLNKNAKIYNYFFFNETKKYFKENNYKKWILLSLASWLEKNTYL